MDVDGHQKTPIRVLLVEDNPGDADLIREFAAADVNRPVIIENVNSMGAFRDALCTDSFELILLDLGLPDSAGLPTLSQVREAAPATPVIVMTGHDDQELARACMNHGAQDFMNKGSLSAFLTRMIYNTLERVALQRSMESAWRSIEDLVGNMVDGVLVLDAANSICFANPKAQELLAPSGPPLLGSTFGLPLTSDSPVEIDLPGGEARGASAEIRTAETDWHGERATLVMIRDTTARRQAERARERLEIQLRQSQRLESLGTLASGVAHEINNPINGIMNYAQLIQDRVEGESAVGAFAQEIIVETKRVANIVRNLLSFARQEKQSHSPAYIADIIEETLSLIQAVIRHDQITLELDVPEDLPSLKCRSQQIQQVLMNLITNGRDALNARYPEHSENKTLTVRAREFQAEGKTWIRIIVEDRGTGISEEVKERMFDPFFTTKTRDAGTGLGLSISHGIVKEHHGKLTVQSQLGEYTRFCIELPTDNGWQLEEHESSMIP